MTTPDPWSYFRSLRDGLQHWRSFFDSHPEVDFSRLLSFLENGVPIPFSSPLSLPTFLPPHYPQSIPQHLTSTYYDIVDQLEARGILKERDRSFARAISPTFLKAKSGGRWRFLIDLRSLNDLISPRSFVLPSLFKDLQAAVPKNAQMLTLDAKDGFFSVPLAEDSKPWTCFALPCGRIMSFERLCQGMNCSPEIFQAFSEASLMYLKWKIPGLQGVVYIDDFLITFKGRVSRSLRSRIMLLLHELGFSLAPDKCTQWSLRVKYLGFLVDSVAYKIIPLTSKLKQVKREISVLLRDSTRGDSSPIRNIASTVGKMIHLSPCFPTLLLSIKPLTHLIAVFSARFGWSSSCSLRVGQLRALVRALECLDDPVPVLIAPRDPSVLLFTDSSLEAAGWHLLPSNEDPTSGEEIHTVPWGPSDRRLAIGALELKALELALSSHEQLRETGILWFSDSVSALSWVRRRTCPWQARPILFRVLTLIRDKRLSITGSWIPSKSNVVADRASRTAFPPNNWVLPRYRLHKILRTFDMEPMKTLEVCSHPDHHTLPRYGFQGSSRDVLLFKWLNEEHPPWLSPPPRLWELILPRILNHKGFEAAVILPTFLKKTLSSLLPLRTSPTIHVKPSQLLWPTSSLSLKAHPKTAFISFKIRV